MNEFFEKFKESVSRTAKVAVQKSNDLVEVTKLKIAIADAEGEVTKLMRTMGEILYEAYKTGGESYASLEEQCELIDAKYAQIAELTERVSALKNVKVCPACKKEMEKDATFCSGCGQRF